jgi:hypothetical protein
MLRSIKGMLVVLAMGLTLAVSDAHRGMMEREMKK